MFLTVVNSFIFSQTKARLSGIRFYRLLIENCDTIDRLDHQKLEFAMFVMFYPASGLRKSNN